MTTGSRAITLDGKALAAKVKADLATRVARLKELGMTPGLGTMLVGDDPGSHAYVPVNIVIALKLESNLCEQIYLPMHLKTM